MKKILVIEDNLDIRENIAEILELSGYEAHTAPDGKAGVEAALKELPDLILCDIMMPELDGFGVLHILSRNQKTADIPFLFLTAKSEKEDFRKGMSLGADDYIVKPFDDTMLLETIEIRLKKSQRLRTATAPATGNLDTLIQEAKALEAIRHLSNDRETRVFRKKDLIFKEKDTPRWLYYVEKGQVKLFKTSDDGRELIIEVKGSGDFLGYLALLQESQYPESAAVLEDAEIRLIPKQDFHTLLHGNRDVAARFLKLLAQHVVEREQQLLDLAYNSVRRRVATVLTKLSDASGPSIHLLREDLASLAGTAKETFIRTLSDFKNEGLIEIKDGVIQVLKAERLRNMHN